MVREVFTALAKRYADDVALTDGLWQEIAASYSQRNRHYHTLEHLENLLGEMAEVKDQIREWDPVLFTLFYHDIVYNPLKSNNEEMSVLLAEKRLQSLAVPVQMIKNCKDQILATKKHLPSENEDTNYFTDADLTILGQDWEIYAAYAKNVRKEYSIYPDMIYNPGRKKVLELFLGMERIFKTTYFFDKYEIKAKDNLQKEIQLLR